MKTNKACGDFCNGPRRTNKGLVAKGLNLEAFEGKIKGYIMPHWRDKLVKDPEGNYYCPLGCSQDPANEETAERIIRAGGRHTICQRNPWKWKKVLN